MGTFIEQTAKERINKLEYRTIEISQSKIKEKQGQKEKNREHPKTMRQYEKTQVHIIKMCKEGETKQRRNILTNNDQELSKINNRHQTTYPETQ